MNFRLGIYHPDENKNYLFERYEDYKNWRWDDEYRYSKDFGGCCDYIYYNDYTRKIVEASIKRQQRYWKNKELENAYSKKWRLERKIEKLKKEMMNYE